MNTIQIENVRNVYQGENGECCCGCSGNYYYKGTPKGRKNIERIVWLLNEQLSDVDDLGNGVLTLESGSTLYIVNTDGTN